MVGYGGSSADSYLADPTSPIPFHCASIVATSTLRVRMVHAFPDPIVGQHRDVMCLVCAAITHLLAIIGLKAIQCSKDRAILLYCIWNTIKGALWELEEVKKQHQRHGKYTVFPWILPRGIINLKLDLFLQASCKKKLHLPLKSALFKRGGGGGGGWG